MAERQQPHTFTEYCGIMETLVANGDCYSVAGNLILYGTLNANAILVHGEVTGQGKLSGIRFGHAWVEVDGLVIDKSNGNNVKIPKATYYRIGRIGKNVHTYSQEETRKMVLKYKTWGPWELKTRSGY